MNDSFELTIATAPGVENLARVVGVFALLGVTVDQLVYDDTQPDRRVRAQFASDDALLARCVGRLESLFAVRRVATRRLAQGTV